MKKCICNYKENSKDSVYWEVKCSVFTVLIHTCVRLEHINHIIVGDSVKIGIR